MIKQGGDHSSLNSWQGSAKLSPLLPSPRPSEFCTDEDNIVNGRLEIFKKIINLLTVTVLFLFTFFTLILDAPRTLPYLFVFQLKIIE